MDEDIQITDYLERPANDKRPPIPKCGPNLMIQNFCHTPQTSPDYPAMTVAAEPANHPWEKSEGYYLRRRRHHTVGWHASRRCPWRWHLETMIYTFLYYQTKRTTTMKSLRKSWSLKIKTCKLFYKLKINDSDDLSKLPHEEEFNKDNYNLLKSEKPLDKTFHHFIICIFCKFSATMHIVKRNRCHLATINSTHWRV